MDAHQKEDCDCHDNDFFNYDTLLGVALHAKYMHTIKCIIMLKEVGCFAETWSICMNLNMAP